MIRLACLNIEKSKHFDLIVPFLSALMPDVFCVQELYESSLPVLVDVLSGAGYVYAPMTQRRREVPPEIQGIGIFSRVPIRAQSILYYRGPSQPLPESVQGEPATYLKDDRMLAFCDVEKDGTIFKVCTTHFTWTPDGKPSEGQRRDMRALLALLASQDEFVLAGDFNAPRGGEIFSMLAEKYKDNVPVNYETSIDVNLHLAGKSRPEELKDKMVDGLFSTPGYAVSDVELHAGVSDHMAITATVDRA